MGVWKAGGCWGLLEFSGMEGSRLRNCCLRCFRRNARIKAADTPAKPMTAVSMNNIINEDMMFSGPSMIDPSLLFEIV
jgi:hypothetical protein